MFNKTRTLVVASAVLATALGLAAPVAAQRGYDTRAPQRDRGRAAEPQRRSAPPQARPWHEVRRPVFVRPYYAFRPRVTLGFGIRVGYPVAYPFQFYDPRGFYNHRIGVSVGFGPGTRSFGFAYSAYRDRIGGLSFDVAPFDAAVFIDGENAGVVDDFSSGQMPLTLVAGRHRVELRARGFRPVSFDVVVQAGRVIPYDGTMVFAR